MWYTSKLYLHRNEGILMFTLHLETVSTVKTRYIHLLQKAGIPMYWYTFKLSNTQFKGISLVTNSRYTDNVTHLKTVSTSKWRYNTLMFTLHIETVSTAKTRYIHWLQKSGIPRYSYAFKWSNTQFKGISLVTNSRYTDNVIHLKTVSTSKWRYTHVYITNWNRIY